jgi:hypothetical protein
MYPTVTTQVPGVLFWAVENRRGAADPPTGPAQTRGTTGWAGCDVRLCVGGVRQAGGVAYEFDATLRPWDARRHDAWVFVDLPEGASDDIADLAEGRTRGFGSVRVDVAIGGSRWRTSIFPGAACYVLPVKSSVRTAEGVGVGDAVHVVLDLVDLS